MPDKIPMTPAGQHGPHARNIASPHVRGAPADHCRDLRSPRPWRSCRKTPSITPPRSSRASTRAAIQELEGLLALAEIIDISKLSGTTVNFGATVKIVDEDTEEETDLPRSSATPKPTPASAAFPSPRPSPAP